VADAIAAGVEVTGATVHFVDEGVDTGQIIKQASVEIHKGDTQVELHERIKIEERKILVETIKELVMKSEEQA
jgi:phosphoribosylglycinamide formyltransferase-1